MQLNNVIIIMAREIIHKKLKVGTLVRIISSNDIGIVMSASWNIRAVEQDQHAFQYDVYVRGKEVRANREVFTVIGEI